MITKNYLDWSIGSGTSHINEIGILRCWALGNSDTLNVVINSDNEINVAIKCKLSFMFANNLMVGIRQTKKKNNNNISW